MMTLSDALEDFVLTNGEPLAVLMVGENGVARAWLAENVQTQEQVNWVAEHIAAGANLARKMERGGGQA